MKKLILFPLVFFALLIIGVLLAYFNKQAGQILNPNINSFNQNLTKATPEPTPRPLERFTFANLAQTQFNGSEIVLERKLTDMYEEEEQVGFESYLFSYTWENKKITGLLNMPLTPKSNKMPVVVLLRGYVDEKSYETGIGTKKAAGVFAKQGAITLAPDFLGFGGSDKAEDNVWWERFSRPAQVLQLLASIKNLPQADSSRIYMWAHSNGGQIALSVLEISQAKIPTTLWAPVSKPFPYSILYYTDEFDDYGKALRLELAKLEQDYDVNNFSISEYVDRIKAPIAIRQGTADIEVPLQWSDELVQNLKDHKIEVEYNVYPAADHNMLGSWEKAIERDIRFFNNGGKVEE